MIDEFRSHIGGLLFLFAATLQFSCFAQKEPIVLGNKKAIVYDLSIQANTGIVAASLGDRIEIWNYRSKGMVQSWMAPKILGIDFRDSLLTGVSKAGFLYLWNMASPSKVRETKISDSPLTCVRFADSISLVAGTDSGDLIKFNSKANKIEYVVKIGHTVTAILIKPKSKLIIVGDSGGILTILNADTGAPIFSTTAHGSWIRNFQTYGEDYMISFSDDGDFITWRMKESGKLDAISKKRHGGWILCGDAFQEKQDGPVVVATAFQSGRVNVYFPFGKYEFKMESMVNSIAIIKEDFPRINLILGTHGSGIQLILGNELKMVK